MADFPTYQKDWTVGNQMFHVRCDDFQAFQKAVKDIEGMIPSNKAFPNDEGDHATSEDQALNVPECGIHHTMMKWVAPGVSKKTGKPYPGFWSCGIQVADGYCKYKPE